MRHMPRRKRHRQRENTRPQSAEIQKQSDADFKNAIEKGTKTDKGMMIAFGGKLSHEQIEGLVKFVRSLKK